MRSVDVDTLKRLIKQNSIVVVQVGTDRSVACKRQTNEFDTVCQPYKHKITCVHVDVDSNPKIINELKLKKVYPSISLFVNGERKQLTDSSRMDKKTDNALYGYHIGKSETLIKKLL